MRVAERPQEAAVRQSKERCVSSLDSCIPLQTCGDAMNPCGTVRTAQRGGNYGREGGLVLAVKEGEAGAS